MALPSSGQISLGGTGINGNSVNVELGNIATLEISLNQSTVRALFQKTTAGSAIAMSDGWGKSAVTAPTWTYGAPSGGDEYICEWDEWGISGAVSGTLPMDVELIMYASSCGSPYAISSVSTGGTGLVSNYAVGATNYYATSGGSYTGGTAYKAAHYRLKVSNSAGEIYSGVYHVNYGFCSTSQTCPGGESCTEACCEHSCDGNCDTGYLCRAECEQSQYDYCNQNPCDCYPYACGYDCSCPSGYEYTTTYDYTTYSPQGACSF